MSNASLQKACMADLGRQRQDELPLCDKEGKRPSYEPTRRNGTGHYAPALKKGLTNAWKVKIQDEESAEMQGLTIGDSRPWAKIAERYITQNQAATAPPSIRQESHGRKRLEAKNDATDAAVGQLGARLPSDGRVVVRFPPPQQPQSLPKETSGSRPERHDLIRSERKPETTLEDLTEPNPGNKHEIQTISTMEPVLGKTTHPVRLKPAVSEHIVYKGLCKLLNPGTNEPLFIVTCALKILNNSDTALLVLSAAGREEQSHNVLDLSAPGIRHDCCLICSKNKDSRVLYTLQYPNVSDAKKFTLYLESLQKAAARKIGSGEAKSESSCIPATPQPPSSTQVAPTEYSAVSEETKLVDVEPSPVSSNDTKVPTIEDAAEMLFDLVERILPEAAAAGLNVSDGAISDIQETAIDNWLVRGFLRSETDDMRSELLDLLRILVRIKRKAELRKQAVHPRTVIHSLQDFESNISKSQRIQYTPSEIQKLSTTKAPSQERLDKAIITSLRTPNIDIHYSTASVTGISKHKAWLHGQPGMKREGITMKTPPMSSVGSGDVEKDNPPILATVNMNEISPPQSPSVVEGLGASRWARD